MIRDIADLEEPQEIGSVIRVAFANDQKLAGIPIGFEVTLVRIEDAFANDETLSFPWAYTTVELHKTARAVFAQAAVGMSYSWDYLQEHCSSIEIGEWR